MFWNTPTYIDVGSFLPFHSPNAILTTYTVSIILAMRVPLKKQEMILIHQIRKEGISPMMPMVSFIAAKLSYLD